MATVLVIQDRVVQEDPTHSYCQISCRFYLEFKLNPNPEWVICTDLLSRHELDLDVDSLSRKQTAIGWKDLKVKWLLLLLLHLTTQVHWHVALGLNNRKITWILQKKNTTDTTGKPHKRHGVTTWIYEHRETIWTQGNNLNSVWEAENTREVHSRGLPSLKAELHRSEVLLNTFLPVKGNSPFAVICSCCPQLEIFCSWLLLSFLVDFSQI